MGSLISIYIYLYAFKSGKINSMLKKQESCLTEVEEREGLPGKFI